MATVVLVRHGETTWNRAGRVQGWAQSALTDRGREQASALGAHLSRTYDVSRAYASDLLRTRQTADHLELDCPVRFESAWRERGLGRLQGFDRETFHERFPAYSLSAAGDDAVEARPPGGESFRDVQSRVLDRFETLVDGLGAEETVLVVTHGGPLYLLTGHVNGLDVVAAYREQRHDNCGLTELVVGDTVALNRENDTSFLDDE